MKVRLESYFKLGDGKMVPMGTVYDSPHEELPEFVKYAIENQPHLVTILEEDKKPEPKKKPAPKKKVEKKTTAKKPAPRRRVVKKAE